MFLYIAIFSCVKLLTTASVFQTLETHKGIAITQAGRIYNSNNFIRIRLDIDLQTWIDQEAALQAQLLPITNNEYRGTPYEQRPLIQMTLTEVRRTLSYFNMKQLLAKLQGHIQPILALVPDEEFKDTTIPKDQYDIFSKTYYLSTSCAHLDHFVSDSRNLGLATIIRQIDNLHPVRPRPKRSPQEQNPPLDDTPAVKPATGSVATKSAEADNTTKEEELDLVEVSLKASQALSTALESQYFSGLTDIMDSIHTGIKELTHTLQLISHGRYPDGCLTQQTWKEIFQAIYPSKSTETI